MPDGFAAGHADPDQVEHVRGVQPGARRADDSAAVSAPDVSDSERGGVAVVGVDDLADGGIDAVGVAAEPGRAGAVADPRGGLGPAVEARGVVDQVEQLAARVGRQLGDVVPGRRGPAAGQRGDQVGHQIQDGVQGGVTDAHAHRSHHPVREVRERLRGATSRPGTAASRQQTTSAADSGSCPIWSRTASLCLRPQAARVGSRPPGEMPRQFSSRLRCGVVRTFEGDTRHRQFGHDAPSRTTNLRFRSSRSEDGSHRLHSCSVL
jgi:hypothetical protein